MKKNALLLLVAAAFLVGMSMTGLAAPAQAAEPIVLGAPLSTAFLYGWDAERAMALAVEEINAAGGVKVGKTKRPLKLEVIDTRDLGKKGRLHRGRPGALRSGSSGHGLVVQT